jgi:hypothetical protein
LYGAYKWLCKIKHPTLRAGVHESGSAEGAPGEFVVIGSPDTRPEDLPVKVSILAVALMRSMEAIEAFAEARRPDLKSEEYRRFRARLDRVEASLDPFRDGLGSSPLPFDISDDLRRVERYRVARIRQELRRGESSPKPGT